MVTVDDAFLTLNLDTFSLAFDNVTVIVWTSPSSRASFSKETVNVGSSTSFSVETNVLVNNLSEFNSKFSEGNKGFVPKIIDEFIKITKSDTIFKKGFFMVKNFNCIKFKTLLSNSGYFFKILVLR